MKDRMLQLMNHLGLTAARFADEMGVQRSVFPISLVAEISHPLISWSTDQQIPGYKP